MVTKQESKKTEFIEKLKAVIASKQAGIFYLERSAYPSDDAFILAYNDFVQKLRDTDNYSNVIIVDAITQRIPIDTTFSVNDVIIYAPYKEKDLLSSPSPRSSTSKDDDDSR